MMTTTTVTDMRSAVQAIREAAVPADGHHVSVRWLSTQKFEEVTVDGLDPNVYRARGHQIGNITIYRVKERAFADVTLDPASDWIEQVVELVDWLATESPVPA